jgi:hypothetical protein
LYEKPGCPLPPGFAVAFVGVDELLAAFLLEWEKFPFRDASQFGILILKCTFDVSYQCRKGGSSSISELAP